MWKLKISISEQILFTLITIIALVNVFFLSEKVVLWLFPFGVLSLLFSIPLWGIKRKFRIRESLFALFLQVGVDEVGNIPNEELSYYSVTGTSVSTVSVFFFITTGIPPETVCTIVLSNPTLNK